MKKLVNKAITGRKDKPLKIVIPNEEAGEPDLKDLNVYDLVVQSAEAFPSHDDRGTPQAIATLRERDKFWDTVEEAGRDAESLVVLNKHWDMMRPVLEKYVAVKWTAHAGQIIDQFDELVSDVEDEGGDDN